MIIDQEIQLKENFVKLYGSPNDMNNVNEKSMEDLIK